MTKKKILVTGAQGFIGKNLVSQLQTKEEYEIFSYDIENSAAELEEFIKKADFIYHLAGINRPKTEEEFQEGNVGLTETILTLHKKYKKNTPILITSSIQANKDNPYGESKREAELLLEDYQAETGTPVYIYRLTNVFGKWSRPNYNSVVTTFCHNIARGLPIEIHNPKAEIELIYIDDITKNFVELLETPDSFMTQEGYGVIQPSYHVTLQVLSDTIYRFQQERETKYLPHVGDLFEKKLYSTYLTYLPEDKYSYPLTVHQDERGAFAEFLRSETAGQVSINISKPGVTKGDHWHHTKVEKFLVVSGQATFQFRKVGSDEIFEYSVSEQKLEVIDIPPGYTHNIINTGTSDLVTIIWANECYDPDRPDTYYLEV